VKWLTRQEWFNGEIISSGPSYNGFTAYTFAFAAGSMLKAISVQLTSADFQSMIYPGDALALETFI
jgi:predicted acyl esterase